MLLIAIDTESTRRNILRFYLFGLGMYGIGISWIYVSIHEHGGAGPLLAGSLVFLFVLAISSPLLILGYLYERFFKSGTLGVVVGFSVLWILKEWIYTWFLTGFPWLLLGYSQLDMPLAGYGPFLGVLGVGFFVVLTASLLFVGLKTRSRHVWGATALILSVVWLTGYGLSRIQLVSAEGKPITVSLIQGNIEQQIKWQPGKAWSIVKTYMDLSRDEWGRQLVVWPEAAIPVFREGASDLLQNLGATAKAEGSTLLLGIPDRDKNGNFLNSAISIGNGEGQYIKRRLVPFGEYVPLEGLLRGVIQLFDLPMSHNQIGDWDQPLLLAGDFKLAVSICYEIVFPDLVRHTPQSPDLLVTISNDTWFGESIGPLQHMQMARMRALENGRYVIRATNNGVSALVDHHGKVLKTLPRFEPGVLRGEVIKMVGVTPFSRFGHFPILMVMLLLLVLLQVAEKVWQQRQAG